MPRFCSYNKHASSDVAIDRDPAGKSFFFYPPAMTAAQIHAVPGWNTKGSLKLILSPNGTPASQLLQNAGICTYCRIQRHPSG